MLAEMLRQLSTSATAKAADLKKGSPETRAMFFMACVCAILPLDISQLAFAILGACLYALLQKSDQLTPQKKVIQAPPYSVGAGIPKQLARPVRPIKAVSAPCTKAVPAPCTKTEIRTPSVQPILAPTFQCKDWDGEVQELLLHITPTTEVEQIVKQLAAKMGQIIRKMFPEADVHGFANGNFTFGKAFGVAVPEVDIIANVNPQTLFNRLHSRNAHGQTAQLDLKKLQKSAIRTCTDQFISVLGFKFRRSAFGGQEPKVTLLVPASLGLFSDAIPIDFSVNVLTPLYNTALLTECGKMDKRAKDLVLFVRRWAKIRGICHAAKGHLSPYLWSLLTMYYLQVGVSDGGPLLPPLDQFEMSSGLLAQPSSSKSQKAAAKSVDQAKWKPQTTNSQNSAGVLFKDFVHFFDSQFDWRNEAVSVRSGRRAPPSLDLPLHIIVSEDTAASQVGPSIEDPFHAAHNLGDGMTAGSFARLKEEFSRAKELCLRGASLSELLEPWAPADPEATEGKEDGDEDNNGKLTSVDVPPKVEASAMVQSSTPPWRRQKST